MMGPLKFKNNHFLIQMDKTDKTQKGSPAFIVKVQHKKLRTKFLKNPKNSKLIWEQVLKNADNLKEYASAMDILSRNWATEGDGIRNVTKIHNFIFEILYRIRPFLIFIIPKGVGVPLGVGVPKIFTEEIFTRPKTTQGLHFKPTNSLALAGANYLQPKNCFKHHT